MSKYIDKEKLLDSVYENTPLIPSMAGMTAEAMRLKIAVLIDNFDSIDFGSIDVVRCKECKYWYPNGIGFCTIHDIRPSQLDMADWFCADGVRKEQNDEID